jgi:transcriptional regulator with XRE-family HTH domain
MHPITPAQIRAARGLLKWTQGDLATRTNLSVGTIGNLEASDKSPRCTTMDIIRNVFEKAGIEFMDGDGVYRRSDRMQIYEGEKGYTDFFNDVRQTVKEKDSEILCVFKTAEVFAAAADMKHGSLKELRRIGDCVPVKCLVSDEVELSLLDAPMMQLRSFHKQILIPASYFIYGNKVTTVERLSNGDYRLYVLNSFDIMLGYRDCFFTIWPVATPVHSPIKEQRQQKQRIYA